MVFTVPPPCIFLPTKTFSATFGNCASGQHTRGKIPKLTFNVLLCFKALEIWFFLRVFGLQWKFPDHHSWWVTGSYRRRRRCAPVFSRDVALAIPALRLPWCDRSRNHSTVTSWMTIWREPCSYRWSFSLALSACYVVSFFLSVGVDCQEFASLQSREPLSVEFCVPHETVCFHMFYRSFYLESFAPKLCFSLWFLLVRNLDWSDMSCIANVFTYHRHKHRLQLKAKPLGIRGRLKPCDLQNIIKLTTIFRRPFPRYCFSLPTYHREVLMFIHSFC